MNWHDEVCRAAANIRLRVLEHVIKNDGGYLSQACSAAEILCTLYMRVMNLGPSQGPLIPPAFCGTPGKERRDYFSGARYNGPKSAELDRFFFSPAHYALVLYAVLIEVGRLDEKALNLFNQDGSTVEMIGAEHSPGVEVMCGSLAQTISQAAGVALARKLKKENGRVWVFMSDGEFQEGQTWEAVQAMAKYKLDNMGIFVDVNGQQCDGETEEVMAIEPLAKKLLSFGMNVITLPDGHDISALAKAAENVIKDQPLFVLAYTDPCRGMGLLQKRRPKLHYLRFSGEDEKGEYLQMLAALRDAGQWNY